MSEELDNELLWVADHEEIVSTELKREEILEIRKHIDEKEQEIERLNQAIKDTKENADEIIVEQDEEIERLNNELELQNIEMGREIEILKDRIERANNFIDQETMYLVKPKDYNKIEMLQDILNDNDFAKGSDKE